MSGIPMGRRTVLKGATALALLPVLTPRRKSWAANDAPAGQHMWGVNLAGAEFGSTPGTHGTDYGYPSVGSIAYYAMLGFTLVRIPFKWERLQPEPGGPLDNAELGSLAILVEHARRLGITIALSLHNHGQRRLRSGGWRTPHAVGSKEAPAACFADLWRRLAGAFKTDDNVIFGLMNEAGKHGVGEWLDIVNATIAIIRAEGAKNLLLVPGVAGSAADGWVRNGNTALLGIRDPLGNFAIEAHQFLDADATGVSAQAHSSTAGSERLEVFQNWARVNGIRAFLGEYGSARDAVSARALMDLCDELTANSDVWIGSAAWAGRLPEHDAFNLEPYPDGREREQTEIIRERAVPSETAARRYWAGDGQEPLFYLDFARNVSAGMISPRAIVEGGGEITKRGLRIDRPFALPRILADFFNRPEYTVIAEIRDIAASDPRINLIGRRGPALLYCVADGGIGTDLAGGLTLSAPAFDPLRRKTRCALSVSTQNGHMVLGMTGAPPVSRELTASMLRKAAFSRGIWIGSRPASACGGSITRLIGFPAFMGQAEIAATVA